MDARTGDLYPSKQAALEAGVPEEDIAEIKATEKVIKRVGHAIQRLYNFEKAKRKRKIQRESRKRNKR